MSIANEELFLRLRPRLVAIGYRMLASVQEAEDLAQDAWLRWYDEIEASGAEIANPAAWLVTARHARRTTLRVKASLAA